MTGMELSEDKKKKRLTLHQLMLRFTKMHQKKADLHASIAAVITLMTVIFYEMK
ncbi:hypothetical protein [Lentibacillus daqui]|uniref:hypothetical protein n=2 Tax=Lentibacillus TaxID=175304 RepID=UPI0022B185DE|nr:hypothetical protein [Lentibacillus daqui]